MAALEHIRVLIIDLPRMLRDLLEQAIAAEPDMLVLEAPPNVDDMAAAAAATGADVLVVAAHSAGELRSLDPALFRRPRLKILGVSHDGRHAVLRELCPRTVQIGNVGPRQLAAAIRQTLREEPAEC